MGGGKPASFLDAQGGADGPQGGFVLLQVEVGGLGQHQHGAGAAVEAARPAGVGQVEAEEAHVVAEGHTDADGSADANQKLSVARAKKICAELKAKSMKLPCTPSGAGSSKPLVSPEKSTADKQKNRRVLVDRKSVV